MEKKSLARNRISYYLLSLNSGLISLSDLAINYYMKDTLEIEPSILTKTNAFIKIAYIIKPIFGLITDLLPIYGYYRKIYLLICAIIYLITWLIVIYKISNFYPLIICIFIIHLTVSFTTVIGQVICIDESTKDKKSHGVMQLYFVVKNIGMLIASYLKGYLIHYYSIKTVYYVCAFNSIFIFLSFILYYEKNDIDENSEKYDEYKYLKANDNKNENVNKSVFKQIIDYFCEIKILIPLFFIILIVASPVYNEPIFYYYSNILKITPYEFGIGHIFGVISNVLILLFYKHFLSKYSFKILIIVFKILLFLSLQLNYILVNQLNKNYISNFYFYLIISSTTIPLTIISSIPGIDLAAKLTPKKLEGTIYAIFIGLINTGTIFGIYSGSFLQKIFGINRNDFTNLNQLIVFSNLCHLIPVFLIIFVPSKIFSHKGIMQKHKGIEMKEIGKNEIKEIENEIEGISDEEMEEKIRMKRTISQL